MPPKRSKKIESSSQPAPEAQKPTRTSGRKRRASDASSVQSERPASSQGPVVSTPAKKRKTRKTTTTSEEPETIIEEEVVVSETTPAVVYPTLETVNEVEPATAGASNDVEMDEEVTHTQSRHVHFGSDDVSEKTTATHKTPHTKMAIKRRTTESPTNGANAGSASKRYRTITHRTSLPATLSEEHEEPIHVVQEHRFVSLREALDERIKRYSRRSKTGEVSVELDDLNTPSYSQKELEKLRIETAEKEKRINELVLELESQRLLGIDANYDSKTEQDKLHAVEVELEVLRKQILLNRARGHLDDHPDENMMVIESQQETAYPRLPRELRRPSTPNKRTTLSTELRPSGSGELLLATPGHRQWEEERRRFQDSILALSREANEATTNLQILSIELKSLGFSVGDDVDDLSVVQSIRDSFEHIRDRLDVVLPGTVPEGASNAEILDLLMANVKEFADLLRIRDREMQEQIALSTDLRIQIDKLLDHLATSEIRIQTLKQRWRELDEGSERKERELEDLEAEIESAEEENSALQDALKESVKRERALEKENANLQQSIQKLTVSLQNYRDEETKLQNIITKMEETHAAVVIKMNTEREAVVLDMQGRLDAEAALRDEAERESESRHALTTGLEARILAVETERDALHIEFQKAQADLTAERLVREQAETEAAQKDEDVAGLETRVNTLETELDNLSIELEELRTLNEAERRQREAAETELDDRNAEIEDINKKLHDRGTEANSLRQKLFEVQQLNTVTIKDLEQAAAERDAQYQEDIAAEVERREDAEEVTRVRDAQVLELQSSLAETEKTMAELLAQRDARIAELETEVAEQDATIASLQDDLRDLQSRFSAQTTQDQGRREELEASIVSLQDTITGYETNIQTMEREALQAVDLHNSEIEDRNAAIAQLNHNVVVLQGKIADLEREKTGLEDRVNAEAEAMLELSAEKEDEIDSLKATILDKQAKILVVEEKAVEADRRWQEVLDARDEELRLLRAEAETNTTTTEEITMQRDSLKQQFQAYIRRSGNVINNLQAALERARATVASEGDALKDEGDTLLEQLEGMDEVTELVSAKKVVQHTSSQSSASKKGASKGNKKTAKRIYDSGFGVASDEFEGESLAN